MQRQEDEAAKARWRQPKQPLDPSPALAIDSMGVEGGGEGGDESSMQPGLRSIDTLAKKALSPKHDRRVRRRRGPGPT